MTVGYYPYNNNMNKYIHISKKCIVDAGCDIVDFDNHNSIDDIDCVILNWYESVPSSKVLKTLYHIIIRMQKIVFLKYKHVKIVTTFHNKKPHDIDNKNSERMIKLFYKWLLKRSDKIIVLSSDTKKYLLHYISQKEITEKSFLIPHPNYVIDEKNTAINSVPNKEFKMLYIGQIRPYKNIEILIEVVKELNTIPISLKIAGMPISEEYKKTLLGKIGSFMDNERIEYDFRFIPENEINSLLHDAIITVLPYDLQSSMNSGTVILSFSNGRSVICPEISTLSDFDKSLVYSYTYENRFEHKEQLKKTIMKAYSDWNESPEEFKKKGLKLYENVIKNNSPIQLTRRYEELFASLIS